MFCVFQYAVAKQYSTKSASNRSIRTGFVVCFLGALGAPSPLWWFGVAWAGRH